MVLYEKKHLKNIGEKMENENIHIVEYNNKKIILVATAHVSEQSALLVEEAINHYEPDTICIELDKDRLKSIKNPGSWKDTDLKQIIKDKKTTQLLASLMLSSYQQRMAKQLGSQVGLEMITAINLAEEKGIPLATVDRNVSITFKRIWNSLSLKEKSDLLYFGLGSIFEEDAELEEDDLQKMLEEDVLTAALNEIRQEIPTIATILVDERDQYLANKIKNARGDVILAVVGGAHVPGIKQEIFKDQKMGEINSIPKKKSSLKWVNYAFMAVILAILILPFFKGFQDGLDALLKWSLYTGVGASITTLLMGAHPLTILATFISAPFAAIHPLLAVGFVAAITEASLRPPTVNDVDNVSEDIKTFKGWRRNRFIRILALVLVANLGSFIGQIISGGSIFSNLFK